MSRLWNEMLDTFRALGGTADNVCLKDGRFGRGLFPIDPSKPIRVHVPESLLIELKDVVFDSGNALRIRAGAEIGTGEKTFLENYQRDFSWGASRRHTEELLQMVHAAPAELRELLNSPFNADEWLAPPTSQAIRDRFLASRVVRYRERIVIMPIIELANHGPGTEFDDTDGIALSGQFPGEILVWYQLLDPWEIFRCWGFATDCAFFALSLHMGLENRSGLLVVGRDTTLKAGNRPFFPNVSIDGDRMTLSFLMLGHKTFPKLARGNFYRIMRDAGRLRSDAEETFDKIQHINRGQFYRLIAAAERAEPPLGRLLRDAARFQLEAMSHNIGAQDVGTEEILSRPTPVSVPAP